MDGASDLWWDLRDRLSMEEDLLRWYVGELGADPNPHRAKDGAPH